jgi:energy-coupling factor transport system permease/ATP-binding protein
MSKASRVGVQVSNLTWTPFASPKPLLNNISFEIEPGERVLLVGPSGSGKSTLLRAVAGVLTETESGELLGKITSDPAGLLLQDPADALVSENIYREVAFGLENAGVAQVRMRDKVSQELDAVLLRKPLSHPSRDLSGGEMQRMAFAGVIAMSPELVLLDEPTSMLDDAAAKAVRDSVMANLDEHMSTLIVVEHRFEAWLPLVTRMLVLSSDGHLLFDGEPGAIISQHARELSELGLWVPGLPSPEPAFLSFRATNTTPNTKPKNQRKSGSLTVLTGKSGAGKTTELRRRLAGDQGAKDIRDGVGYVPQQPELTVIGNSVLESASLTARERARSLGIDSAEAVANTKRLLEALGVLGLAGSNPYEISGGEQRRVAVATSLAHSPIAIFMDEPTVGQDRDAWAAIVGAILSAREAGVRVTVATHDADLIGFADQVIVIEPESSAQSESPKPLVSGLAILAAPLFLLVGSMGVTTVMRGLVAVIAVLTSMAVLGLAGMRIEKPKSLIPGLIGIVSIGFSNWYLSDGLNPNTGLVAAMRVSLFVIPGILLAANLRAIPLGDQLGQRLKLPARPVVAAAAAMQRIDSLLSMWGELRFIHNIRGLRRGRSPWSRLAAFSRLTFALLIQAIRGAGTTAVAMESRGFSWLNRDKPRTWAELPKRGKLDWLVLGFAVLVAIAPLVTS